MQTASSFDMSLCVKAVKIAFDDVIKCVHDEELMRPHWRSVRAEIIKRMRRTVHDEETWREWCGAVDNRFYEVVAERQPFFEPAAERNPNITFPRLVSPCQAKELRIVFVCALLGETGGLRS